MLDPRKYPTRVEYLRQSAERWNDRAALQCQLAMKYDDLHREGASPVHKHCADHHHRQAALYAKYAREDTQTANEIEAARPKLGIIGRALRALGVIA